MAAYNSWTSILIGFVVVSIALTPWTFRFFGRLCGDQIRSSTSQRRELLLERAAKEDQARRDNDGASGSGSNTTASSTSLDDDWEKVNTDNKASDSTKIDSSYAGIIGFFHPFCNAGGGGERVLFAAVLATQQRYPNSLCVVYTGDHDASKEQIVENVKTRFNIDLNPARVCFLYLSTRDYIVPSSWPRLTLLGQSLGSILVAWDAFTLLAPDIFVDTMGFAFTLATCKWLFPYVPTGAYVHYPTISTDMLSSLHSEVGSQGLNAGLGKGLRGKAKQLYWELFAKLYSRVGGSVDVVMTNSSWTQNHISQLWSKTRQSRGKQHDISVVYPPTAVKELASKIPINPTSEKARTRDILYIAQFRPEKMHHVIIDAYHAFLKTYKHLATSEPLPNLILAGSVRDDHDEKRVYKLRLQAQETRDRVKFVVNARWSQIEEFLKSSSIGVNGMWNEHFGIGVVEYQAAGLISVVHDSGGPREDIVVPVNGKPTGFHATTPEQFAEGFAKALELSREDALAMRLRARESAKRFSEEVFAEAWVMHLERLVALTSYSGVAGLNK